MVRIDQDQQASGREAWVRMDRQGQVGVGMRQRSVAHPRRCLGDRLTGQEC